MRNDQMYFKLREILREKYSRSFYSQFRPYENDPNKDLETQWHLYLTSIGCHRSSTYTNNSIECPDSYHRAYNTHYVEIPDELAFKMLSLGSLP